MRDLHGEPGLLGFDVATLNLFVLFSGEDREAASNGLEVAGESVRGTEGISGTMVRSAETVQPGKSDDDSQPAGHHGAQPAIGIRAPEVVV